MIRMLLRRRFARLVLVGILMGVFTVLLYSCAHQVVVDSRPVSLEKKVEIRDNGSKQSQYTYYLKGGSEVLHGTLKQYSLEGRLLLKSQYVHGHLDGLRVLYDEQGKRKLIERYRKGQLDGTSIVYEHGRKVREARFSEGVLREATRWDQQGTIRVRFQNDSEGKIIRGVSYDPRGNVTGKVVEGTGRLVIPIGDQQVRVTVGFENGVKISEEISGETGEDFDFVDPVTPFQDSR